MQLTRQADYAVRIVLDLTGRYPQGVARSAEISRRQHVPRAFLAKIVRGLARAGIVQTARGAGGGIRLVEDPSQLTLRQVIEAIEGPIRLNRCLLRPRECPLDRTCPVHPVWQRVQRVLIRELDAVTFAQLRHP
ncbi:MAG: Rrf2 family transcriptional regulator [Armatimonadota bacterium]|nr:Rrf2 family transcriptional regulator [Armatimonadota bacterium]MDR7486288.1 Rrf2 family transcriptional regulator [Armatimonadota bacterium]MDR7532263.1 Rrf2 family transcriptional regulator [Armatimonadota bacterium]MDR7537264.1 Rrf2 family transcriptional regulator [Armatimonadota bacterium]